MKCDRLDIHFILETFCWCNDLKIYIKYIQGNFKSLLRQDNKNLDFDVLVPVKARQKTCLEKLIRKNSLCEIDALQIETNMLVTTLDFEDTNFNLQSLFCKTLCTLHPSSKSKVQSVYVE